MGLEFSTAVKRAAEADREDETGKPEATPFTVKEYAVVKDDEGKPVLEDGEEVTELVREVECNAYYPGDGQVGMMLALIDRTHSTTDRVAAAINFFMAVLDSKSYTYVAGRLMKPDYQDPFGLEEVTDIAAGLVEEWIGRPTKPSSGSTPSRRPTGRKSTQATRA